MIRFLLRPLAGCLVLASAAAFAADSSASGSLRAGAARIDITPAPDAALPMSGYAGRIEGFKSIHDNLHVRAIVVDDGSQSAALIGVEVVGMSHAFWEKASRRVTAETGIPTENILLAGTHTHAAPAIGTYNERVEGEAARAKRTAYVQKVEDAIVASVRQAKTNLQPARMGYGTGQAKVNMNRRAPNGEGGWMLGNNPDGVSDKTVVVIKFETLAGEPFAIFSNYSVHGTVMGQGNLQISADLPGATARVVEQHYGDKVVSPWTSAAAGDQDPIYRTGTSFPNLAALGQVLGSEVIRVADAIKTSPRGKIRALQKTVSCPGKRTVQPPGKNREYKFEDADPVSIRLSLLVINDIAIAGVSAEVLTTIASRLKLESPLTKTFMVTHCNGSSGYIPDDAAYDQVSYEITTTRVKRGCAENAIVNGFLEMIAPVF